jgi:hypothetical protein
MRPCGHLASVISLAAAYASNGDIKIMISQTGTEISSDTIRLILESGTLARLPPVVLSAQTTGPETRWFESLVSMAPEIPLDWLSPHDRQNRSDSGMGPLQERHGLIATVTACCISTIGSITAPGVVVRQSQCQGN